MKRSVSIAAVILVFALSITVLSSILTSQLHQAMAGKKIEYRVVEAGGFDSAKLGNAKHVERLLNVISQEGWEFVNVIPMTDLIIFKK